MERPLALHRPGTSDPTKAIADGIVTFCMFSTSTSDENEDEDEFGKLAKTDPSFSWSPDFLPSKEMKTSQPMLMVYEAKVSLRFAAVNQLVYDFTTAINHRIALGLDVEDDKNAVYGLLQVGFDLELYVATSRELKGNTSDTYRKQEIVGLLCFSFSRTTLIISPSPYAPQHSNGISKSP